MREAQASHSSAAFRLILGEVDEAKTAAEAALRLTWQTGSLVGLALAIAHRAGESGLAFEGHTFHDLRHPMATRLLRAGASIVDVSRQLGHSNITTTMNFYAHCLPEDDARLTAFFDRRIADGRKARIASRIDSHSAAG